MEFCNGCREERQLAYQPVIVGFDDGGFPERRQANWTSIPRKSHSISYEDGPVPFVLVRERIADNVGSRDPAILGTYLFLGQTLELDCRRLYEAKAPEQAFGGNDVMPQDIGYDCILLLDVQKDHKPAIMGGMGGRGGTARGDNNRPMDVIVNFNDATFVALEIPWRGVSLAVLCLEATTHSGDAVTTATLDMIPRGGITAQGASAPTFTVAGDRRAFLIGDEQLWVGYQGLSAANCIRLSGPYDRLRLRLGGTGTVGFNTIRVSLQYVSMSGGGR